MSWQIFETEASSAEAIMSLDSELLKNLGEAQRPILHLYEWQRESATYGHFVKPERFLNLHEVQQRGLDLARRPTGGGILFHLWDLAFSVLIPAKSSLFSINTFDNYRLVNDVVKEVVSQFLGKKEVLLVQKEERLYDGEALSFCMAHPTRYDVVLNGKKVAGAAQRKTRGGFLHQGTVALVEPDEEFLASLLYSSSVKEAIMQTTFSLLADRRQLNEGKKRLKELLRKNFLNL